MSENTPRHKMPYILASQAQKHVTHNESLRYLDGLCNLLLIDIDVSIPPSQPNAGDAYFLSATPSGDWLNNGNNIATFIDGGWMFFAPFKGLRAYLLSQSSFIFYDGSEWLPVINPPTQLTELGINTAADLSNKLAVKSESVLFSADDQTANPTGDIRLVLNRDGDMDTASVLFQSAYSSSAEIGCTGDKMLRFKVSDDGTQFKDAIKIDQVTGYIGLGKSPTFLLDMSDDKEGGLSRIRMSNARTASGSGSALSLSAGNGHSTQLLQYASGSAYLVTSSSSLYLQTTGQTPLVRFYVGSVEGLQINVNNLKCGLPLKLPSYLVAQLPSASTSGAGAQIYVSNESGGAVTAYSDGTNWRRTTDRIIVS